MNGPVRKVLLVAIALILAASSSFGQAALSRHPYPQMSTQDSVAILWRTVGGSIPIVRFGPAPDLLINEVLPVQILVRLGPDVQGPAGLPRLHSAPPDTYQYEASVFGLQPGTKYFYGIYDDDRLLAGGDFDHSFTTLPTSDSTEPLRLWVVGDSGNGSVSQIAGFDAMRTFVAADGKDVDAYLHLGDMAYGIGRDNEFSSFFFDIYTELLRDTVCWPTMGNHEGITSSGINQIGPYYDSYAVPTQGESGGEASGTEAYYSFDIGRVHFICLDSHDLNRAVTGDMAMWLQADLEMTNADWLIAFWHHPPYTKGSHNSDTEIRLIEMREFIMPILESAGVDLVLTGHSHIYERSMLIDGAYATPTVIDGVVLDDGDGNPTGHGAYRKSASLNPNEGTVAIVAGHGRSAAAFFGRSPVMRSMIAEVGSVMIDIDGDTLTGTMINSLAEVRDVFQLVKQGEVEPEIVEFPWQPLGPKFRFEKLSADSDVFVEVIPVPDAPDAVIHYTIDGSDPDINSPLYLGPIQISGDQKVRAITVWRDGQRVGVIGESPTLPVNLSSVQYLRAGGNDGFEDSDGIVDLVSETLPLMPDHLVGLRFENVQVPAGAYVTLAQVEFEAAEANPFGASGDILGERVANSPAFSDAASEFSGRAKTSATTRWFAGPWSQAGVRSGATTSANFGAVVSEIVALPGWQSGNAVSLFFTLSGLRVALAADAGPSRGASLRLGYIGREGLAEELAGLPIEIAPPFNGDPVVNFSWLSGEAASALGLSYEIEASRDLGSWVTVPEVTTGFNPGANGFGRQFVAIDLGPRAGDGRVYFRVRISQTPVDP